MKFKLGDKVKVLDTKSARRWKNGEHVGKTGYIGIAHKNYEEKPCYHLVYKKGVGNDDFEANFEEKDLKLVTKKENNMANKKSKTINLKDLIKIKEKRFDELMEKFQETFQKENEFTTVVNKMRKECKNPNEFMWLGWMITRIFDRLK